jgi:uncharacterized protein YecE (DUF72 family)
MRVRTGTSGYSFKEWKGDFYPEKLSDKKMLAYYAERLDTVEINYTFRRIPKTHVVAAWGEKVPETFRFSLKASQHTTHRKRLKECDDVLGAITERTTVIGDQLGATLFQLPPNLKQDVPRLVAFLGITSPALRPVFEFRHPSWFDEETYAVLREHGVPLVVSDQDGGDDPPLVATADRGYFRFRRQDYDDAALTEWAQRIRDQPWDEVLVYFKHEAGGVGPRLAQAFRALF